MRLLHAFCDIYVQLNLFIWVKLLMHLINHSENLVFFHTQKHKRIFESRQQFTPASFSVDLNYLKFTLGLHPQILIQPFLSAEAM